MDSFEKLRCSFKNCFISNKTAKQNLISKQKKGDIENASLCSLIDLKDRQKFKFKFDNEIKDEIDTISLSLVPPIYFIINISLFLILFFLKFKNNIQLNNDLYYSNKVVFPSFYELYKVNSLIFHIYYSISVILGLIITILVYNYVKKKLNFAKENLYIKYVILTFLLLFGLIYNLGTLLISFIPYFTTYYSLNEQQNIIYYQAIFINSQFGLYVFGVLSLIVLLNYKYNNKVNTYKDNFWIALKIIVFTFLLILTIVYLMILLNSYNLLTFLNSINKKFEYSLSLLPYPICFLSNLFVFTFYYELNSVNASLKNSSCN